MFVAFDGELVLHLLVASACLADLDLAYQHLYCWKISDLQFEV